VELKAAILSFGLIQAAAFLCSAQVFWSPIVLLNGANPQTNECHTAFADPGAVANGLPGSPLAISVGAYHSLALKADGSVVGWGNDEFGEIDPPTNLTNAIAISAGGYQSLALKSDGSIAFWGDYNGGIIPPDTETDIVAIAAGFSYSLALKADGTVAGWGEYEYGFFYPVSVPDNVTNVIAIAAGFAHSLALKADGSIIGWGDDSFGQIDIPPNATNVVDLSAGYGTSYALKADGTVIAWGFSAYSQTNVPDGATNIVAIAAGDLHCMALKTDGTVIAWGWDAQGQADVPPSATNVIAIGAGYYTSLVLRGDGLCFGWGSQTPVPTDLSAVNLSITVSGNVDTNAPGTYTLTYTTTNNFGAVGTATRTVVVADTLPPALNCPSDLTVDFSDLAGAPVFFTVTASDLCSGAVLVSNVPPSGSVFPIGTTTVTSTATDDSGNTGTCSFVVTVLSARGVKEDILAKVRLLQPPLLNVRLLKAIITNLTHSLAANLWLDDEHLVRRNGSSVFIHDELAVSSMIGGRRTISKTAMQELITRLVNTDRLLAAVEINAVAHAGSTRLRQARNEMAVGDQAAAHQNYVLAIAHYSNAWKICTGQ
jgi:hypothetical protein